jgi:Leucine-rich repeat (LRR) protein
MIGDECRDISEFLIGDEVSFAYHKLYNVPSSSMSERVVNMVTKIDLTETEVRDLGNLRDFPHLEVLVLDKNGLSDLSSLPVLEKVNTLWLNNNHLADLSTLMDDIVKKCPNLVFLSKMRNPCCRGYMDIENHDLEAVRLQRLV